MRDSPVLLVPLFVAYFAALWCAVTLLMSWVSGWRSLARRYRGRLPDVADRVTMASGMFGWVSYNHVLNVAVGAQGIELSVFRLFALGSPPLVVPWHAISGCRRTRWLGLFDRFSFSIDGGMSITLAGSAALMVERAWQGWGVGAARPAAGIR